MRHLIIKAARIAANLTQDEWAQYMHRSLSTVKSWEKENGNEPNTMRDHARICQRLQIPAELYMFEQKKGAPIKPHHIEMIQLSNKLTKKQRKILIELMESMIKR